MGPIQKLLDQLGLLRYFSEVYGNIGDAYGQMSWVLRSLLSLWEPGFPDVEESNDSHGPRGIFHSKSSQVLDSHHNYGQSPFIVDFTIKNMDFPHFLHG